MTNPEMSELIAQSEAEIAALKANLDRMQERHDLLNAVEAVRESILLHLDRAIEMLNKVAPTQVATFKSEIDAKFEAAEWRSECNASKIGEIVFVETKMKS
jgi:hypothetical protein